jgi:hypothetical protein
MVAANLGIPSRKSFSSALQAFAAFQAEHPDSLLYLHSILEAPDGEPTHACSVCIEARKLLRIPQDAFVVGMVAANLGIPSFPPAS